MFTLCCFFNSSLKQVMCDANPCIMIWVILCVIIADFEAPQFI